MRINSSVTSISWIPSEAMTGHMRIPMDIGLGHYDDPPPDRLGGDDRTAADDLDGLQQDGRFRFANRLAAWIEVDDDGRITGHGHDGRSYISTTDLTVGGRWVLSFTPVAFPNLRPDPEVGDGWVRFTQTAGGRTGAPMPRRVSRPPFVRVTAPTAWTTLSLTLHADGRVEREVAGASPFPRHWFYDDEGELFAKSGITDFRTWSREHFGDHSPWGDVDAPALVTAVESALERQLSLAIMREGRTPRIVRFDAGDVLVSQGEEGSELFLLLDGVVEVSVDGEPLTELGPGVVIGERAVLEGGRRTSTVRATTPVKVAVASADDLDRGALERLADQHRLEDQRA